MTQSGHLRRIRFWLAVFIIGLVLSGITAFPLETELSWLVSILHAGWLRPISEFTGLLPWIERVNDALRNTNAFYPFLAYGTDWLAFAHLAIAIAFVGRLPLLVLALALSGRRERTDRNVISVRISERELLGLSVRIHVWLLFEPSESACPLKRQVEIIDSEEQKEPVAGCPVIGTHQRGMLVGAPLVEREQDSSI
jgi:hypothetical protein